MYVGILSLALRLPGAQTLKDKRAVLRRLLDVSRRRFGVSAAEVEDQDLCGNATLAYSFVSANKVQVESTLQAVVEFVESHAEVDVFDCYREIERFDPA